uniref:CSON013237 protein n=1 Tax=Culicoides sonorensis TaxID=179676 RepID=A0A336LNI4_CULSO
MSFILSVVLIVTVIFALYKYVTRKNNFFLERNVPFLKPVPLFGNQLRGMLRIESGPDMLLNMGSNYRDVPFIGWFDFMNPGLIVQSPEIIKQLCIKDFENFVNHRGFGESEIDELFNNSLFLMKDQRWKDMRATLSPAFTGAKMRMMFDLVKKCAQNMVSYCNEKCVNDNGNMTTEARDLFTRVTTDVIATCAFGLEVDCLRDPKNQIFENSKKILDFESPIFMLKFMAMTVMPKIAKWLEISVTPKATTEFFKNLVSDTISHRRKTNAFRPDVIQLLIQAMDGKLKHEIDKKDDEAGFATIEESEIGKKSGRRDWTDAEIAGQCFIFFLAGYETTATLLNFAAYQLAVDQEIQSKLYEEIQETKNRLDGDSISYEILMKMEYLDAFICECLRMYPPMIAIDRVCSKDTTIDDGKGNSFTIPKGMFVFFNPFAVHYNPKYYPNPAKFDPTRFLGENKKKIEPYTFISFGVGPRACIGSRFALMQAKLILYHILAHFSIHVSQKTVIPLRFSKGVRFEPEGSIIDLKIRN